MTAPAMVRTFLSEAELVDRLGIGRSTLRRWIENDQFPAQVRLGPNRVAWRVAEVEAWEASRGAA
jgi:prophage regulatory protein